MEVPIWIDNKHKAGRTKNKEGDKMKKLLAALGLVAISTSALAHHLGTWRRLSVAVMVVIMVVMVTMKTITYGGYRNSYEPLIPLLIGGTIGYMINEANRQPTIYQQRTSYLSTTANRVSKLHSMG
jgi:hypothetical protein